MFEYIGRRVLLFIPVTLLLAFIVFSLVHLIPGDPVQAMLAEQASPETIDRLRSELGFDRPMHLQFFSWLGRAVRGDLGQSVRSGQPVAEAIGERLPVTFQLASMSMIVAVLVAIPTGVLAAVKKDTLLDTVSRMVALAGLSVPSFFLGIVLMYLFAYRIRLFPASGYVWPADDILMNLRSVVLPCVSLGLIMAALLSRMTRSTFLEVLREDYIRTARAKGLAERVVYYRHALRNALIPVVTIAGLQFGALLGGTVVIEMVFAMPGMGRLLITNVYASDFPVVQGVILFLAVFRMVVNLATDLIYSVIDPRIRYV